MHGTSSTKIDARSCNRRCEADIVTEGFELPDGPGFGLFRFPFQVEVRAGIRVNLTVGEHVPGRGQDDVFDGDDGFDLAAPQCDQFVFDAEVSVFAA